MFVGPVVRIYQVPEINDEKLWILNFLGYERKAIVSFEGLLGEPG